MKKLLFFATLALVCTGSFAQLNWSIVSTPVLSYTSDPTSDGAYGPMVIKTATGYKMWYTRSIGSTSENIAYPTSPDGTTWTLVDSLALIPENGGTRFDSKKKLGQPAVIQDGDTLKMWYWGNGPQIGNIGYAWSLGGKAWTKVDGAGTGKSVYDRTMDGSSALALTTPTVIKDGGIYKMWYSRYGASSITIAYATSPDGLTWTNVPGPLASGNVVGKGGADTFDQAAALFPTVIKKGGKYLMWYVGYDALDSSRIGHATSDDGINWAKVAGTGEKGSCISAGTTPSVVEVGGELKMWFAGKGGFQLATSGGATGLISLEKDQLLLAPNHLSAFKTSSEIAYSIANPNHVSLAIYGTQGNKIKTLVDAHQKQGDYTVSVEAGKLPRGVYIYRLKVGSGFSDAKKMIVR